MQPLPASDDVSGRYVSSETAFSEKRCKSGRRRDSRTAVAIIYSPWGQQSGGHVYPSVTLTFLCLGKVEPWDALFYIGTRGIFHCGYQTARAASPQ